MGKHEDLIGKRFGKLTVVSFRSVNNNGHAYWLCRCDCGRFTVVRGAHLKDKHVRSCGCWNPRITHGMSNSRIYGIWEKMLQRCYNENSHAYFRYGGRGISVCKEWHKFEPFFDWAVQNGYQKYLSIDRKNNDGNYEPSNCRWATPQQQANNTRKNRLITFEGRTQTMIQWAREKGIKQSTLSMRINKYGWSAEKALRKGA